MLINNIDITTYEARLIDRVISTTHINSFTDWMDEAAEGVLLRQAYDWRNIKLTFLVNKNNNEDQAYRKISALTEALKECVIRFDDIELDFRCVLDGTTQPERLQNGFYKVTFTLKNDWGQGDNVVREWIIDKAEGKLINIKYVRNWVPTMEGYSICFDETEKQEDLGTEELYVDVSLVEELAERNTSWSEFFLELGVPVNKYKQVNELNGFLDINVPYSPEVAKIILEQRDKFTIYYNRFHKDGYPDFPGGKTYPSLVWQTPWNNNYYFSTGVGKGWNIQDISIVVTGRWYKASPENLGGMFGAYTDNYGITLKGESVYYDMLGKSYAEAVIEETTETSSGGFIIATLEDLAALPLREYAIKSSNEGASPVKGYVDLVFNGVTLTRYDCSDSVLTKDITIGISSTSHDRKTQPALNCDIARARIYYKGQLVRDFIPIDGNLKNCFINTWDTGLYDIISMKYVGWSRYGGANLSYDADAYMPIPGMPNQPTPPPASKTYKVTVVNGTGSGNYEKGAVVTIVANPPVDYKHEFWNWEVTSGSCTIQGYIDQTPLNIVVEESDVTIEAIFGDAIPPIVEPQWMLYNSLDDLFREDEYTIGHYTQSWTDEPRAGMKFVIAFSLPGVTQVSYIDKGFTGVSLAEVSRGTHQGRQYIELKSSGTISDTGFFISGRYNGSNYTQNFDIHSLT